MTDKIKVVIANLKPFDEKFDDLIKLLKTKLLKLEMLRDVNQLMHVLIAKQNLLFYMRYGTQKKLIKSMLSGEKNWEFTI